MIWIAQYKDGTSLRQFNPDSSENLFKDINQSRLEEFCIIDDNLIYSVNLANGIFNLNGLKLGFNEINQDDDLRLIYFRRVRNELGAGTKVTYNIGYQTTKDKKNIKRYLMISDEGFKFNCGGR